ncbi:uncharacterized protein LOC129732404 [Wyeomyia smithii]|uniref:uncharacterized protein LOC129732404 n=1 Tax=Wyeomyia smithii TaxID=174621 RepID=UPI0024681E18|nr:uncharacterized protein LOC129732404 [Wyeomyia smithii]XP_055549234.1 uncharacterized protein LOC129732404 [Wyeomyia smithii]XP_055549235.1 uncharacterized protein LOC129732404 [Wyeomyia smithii]XP_055549236.1 uncharacterized protein LOC129732404 [Wyeomyia smithii]XP_055549237.1 uncharacterized protein LOC129732404 [Wyeomyia smithii]XP_055549238.1 uncharacterized protein LOC129732404 [Wyeomyia smithii]
MPGGGVVFLVCVPTANYERALINGLEYGNSQVPAPSITSHQQQQNSLGPTLPTNNSNIGRNLNINVPENAVQSGDASDSANAVLRLEVELRDKHVPPPSNQRAAKARPGQPPPPAPVNANPFKSGGFKQRNDNCFVPMEQVLEELLKKLEIEHVLWHPDRTGHYYQVLFPLAAGDPCETTLHCLTELGIGVRAKSSVSVLPCSVCYDGSAQDDDDYGYDSSEENPKWNSFVESIRSKLTVKQVVDGVRAGGSLSFDYLLLIVTADSLAALGLVENNAPNIVAAMLVSPLMGPVMSITFGAIIADRELVRVGFVSLALGMFISILFGFIFGLILGTTEMPWGFGDFPTEEMKGRGNARSLWMGILWALTSGSGVAVALLQGSAGPLIGVAISASLLPPVVNCGLFWALACIWLIYEDIKIPHLKGEPFRGNSSYEFIYTNYIPTEFLISGIVSGLLTVINVICIFITAIIVLKIKEVAAPYTSSPDLRRFWETDIRTARTANRTTIRRRQTGASESDVMSTYAELEKDPKARSLETALEQALKEAVDDDTYRKVKRMSYSGNAANEIAERLFAPNGVGSTASGTAGLQPNRASIRNSKNTADLKLLEKLVTSLLEAQDSANRQRSTGSGTTTHRLRPLSRSFRLPSSISRKDTSNSGTAGTGGGGTMPTIRESAGSGLRINSWGDQNSNVRRVLSSIANAPHRFSQSLGAGDANNDEERSNLTQNIL